MIRKNKLSYAIATAIGAGIAGSGHTAEIEEVIVTATKRAESAQDIPLTVQALGQETIEQLGIENFDDYIASLPGVTQGGRGPGRQEVYIRGITVGKSSNKEAGLLTEPNVAMYLDEAPITMNGRNIDVYMADMNRVEVLPGPQGTLFGASSQAGTVRLVTNKPDFDGIAGGFNSSYAITEGGDDSTSIDAYINMPLIDDKLAARLVMYNAKQGGYIDNIFGTDELALTNPRLANGGLAPTREVINNSNLVEENFNDASYQGLRLGVLYAINDSWDVLIQHLHQNIDSEGVFDFDPSLGDYNVQTFQPDESTDDVDLTSLTITGAVGNLELVYAGSFTDREVESVQDYAGYADTGPFVPYYICNYPAYTECGAPDFFIDQDYEVERDVHEFRIATDPEKRVRGIAGVYLDDTEIIERTDFNYPASVEQGFVPNGPISGATSSNPNPRAPGVTFFNDYTRGKEEISFFGEVAFDITDQLTATVGARNYDIDISLAGSTNFANREFGLGDLDFGQNADANLAGQSPANLSDTIWKFNLKWQATDDVMLYTTLSEGYRPGGFNRNGGASAVPGQPPFVPFFYESDEVTNYEIGWKSTLLDGSLRFNGAAYLVDWEGMQTATLDFSVSNIAFIDNVADSEIQGIEMDAIWAASDNLTIFANVSYNDTELTNVPGTVVNLVPEGSSLALAPELQYVLRGRYEWDTALGEAFAQISYSYTDDAISSIQATGQGRGFPLDSYSLVDASIGMSVDNWTMTLYGQNLTDELAELYKTAEDLQARTTPNRPRTIGVRVSFDF